MATGNKEAIGQLGGVDALVRLLADGAGEAWLVKRKKGGSYGAQTPGESFDESFVEPFGRLPW